MIEIRQLVFRHGPDFELAIPELDIAQGEQVALVGPSGSGKSTLLMLLAGIHVAATGSIRLGAAGIDRLSDDQRRRFRNRHLGLIFQDLELIHYLTVRENVQLPWLIGDLQEPPLEATSLDLLLQRCGLSALSRRYPSQLSQGERQRVAVARGLATRPAWLLADEPTASLDVAGGRRLLGLIQSLAREWKSTCVVVTHDADAAGQFDRTIDLLELNQGQRDVREDSV